MLGWGCCVSFLGGAQKQLARVITDAECWGVRPVIFRVTGAAGAEVRQCELFQTFCACLRVSTVLVACFLCLLAR